MTDIVGEFTMSKDKTANAFGHLIANEILHLAKNDEISINDDIFKEFLCVVFEQGNIEFLKVIAEKWYPDSRKDVIINFLDEVWKLTKDGEEQLRKKGEAEWLK